MQFTDGTGWRLPRGKFLARLHRELPHWLSSTILGFPGGIVERPVVFPNNIRSANNTLKDVATPRNRSALGIGIPSSVRSNGTAVEANASLKGVSGRLAELFARNDRTGNTVLLHRGRFSGWRKGVERAAFLE